MSGDQKMEHICYGGGKLIIYCQNCKDVLIVPNTEEVKQCLEMISTWI